MAKRTKTETFKNAIIDMDDMTITETFKDDSKTYNIMDILKEWDNIDGVSLTIKRDAEIPSED